MGYNRKSAAILSSNKQMQPLHSREIFHSKNKTKPQQKKGNNYFHRAPTERNIYYKTTGNEKKKKKKKNKVGTATEHTSVIPEECGGQATPLSSA